MKEIEMARPKKIVETKDESVEIKDEAIETNAEIESALKAKDKEMQEKGNNAKQDAQVPTYQERLKAVAANKSK